MTYQARLWGRSVQVLKPSKGGMGPRRWQTLIRIPSNANRRKLLPIAGRAQQGFEYKWRAGGKTYRVRLHDADPSVVPGPANPAPNARMGWIVRIAKGKRYMDPTGTFHPAGAVMPGSASFDEFIANETHIPLIAPVSFP